MTTCKVVIPPSVAAEIEEIGDYIARENPAAAKRMMQKFLDRCISLENFPLRGRVYKGEHRVLIEGSYLIFYRVTGKPDDMTAIIVAVIHGARDIEKILDI